ncbi:DUF2497 domain-containing protein, partial [Azospirillum brasilense]|uniref:DUF2497 domain-containing protein n=1 Tax=Azospirillum brasilense TaxID=192 RepID=UPI001FFFE415
PRDAPEAGGRRRSLVQVPGPWPAAPPGGALAPRARAARTPAPDPPPPPPRPAVKRPAPAFDDFDDDEPPPPRPRIRQSDLDNGLISRRVAEESSHHFTHLARQLGDDLSIGPMPVGVRTVEEVVRELLKPLLKEWLDENLPTIVERLVQQEIDRMIRRSQKF